MSQPKFSIIIPVYSNMEDDVLPVDQRHYRGLQVQRAIKSVINQQYPDWELILVNDGCTDHTPQIMQKFADSDKRIKIVNQENQNRAIARNRGMDEATGEWLCWLDSDDEYSTHYLRELNQATIDFPEFSIFNFGSIIHFPDHRTAIRQVFTPLVIGEGHEYFRSGHIGTGSFVFKRDLWLKKGNKIVRVENEDGTFALEEQYTQLYRIPDEVNPYQFAAASLFDMRFTPENPDFQFIENAEMAFIDGVYRHGLSLGNPWGDDGLAFYLLTRDNISKPLDVLLYIQYPRAHEEVYQHFGEIYNAG